jgi:hypothetical protein
VRNAKDEMMVDNGQQLLLPPPKPLLPCIGLAFWAMAVTAGNGELSITCLMGSVPLWGVRRVNDAHVQGRTRVQLPIKIWLT